MTLPVLQCRDPGVRAASRWKGGVSLVLPSLSTNLLLHMEAGRATISRGTGWLPAPLRVAARPDLRSLTLPARQDLRSLTLPARQDLRSLTAAATAPPSGRGSLAIPCTRPAPTDSGVCRWKRFAAWRR